MIKGTYKLCLGKYSIPIYEALLAETRTPSPEKGKVNVDITDDCLIITISSNTISGFRALTNSFLLLTYAAYSSLKIGDE